MWKQRQILLTVCIVLAWIAPSAWAEVYSQGIENKEQAIRGTEEGKIQPITDIPSLNEVEQPLTTAEGLLVQQPAPTPQTAQVTGVQLKPTDKGLEVILETATEFPEVLTSTADNTLITDIPNAQLRLPGGGAFRQNNPTPAIALVEVTNLDAKTLRVTVTGKTGVPTAEVSQSPQALILSVATPLVPPAPPPPAPTAPPATPAPAPPPAAPEPKPQAEEELLQLEVRAEEEAGGYNVPDATTATKTDTPLRDIPQSIQVIPEQLLEDRQVTRVQQAADNVPGVQPYISFGGLPTAIFFIRGFDTFGLTYRDGFRDFGSDSGPVEVANVERIEFLKGPTSVLYGQNNPGGLVNIISKQPLRQPYYSPSLTIGSFDFYRPTLDVSGPLDSQARGAYRLNLAYQNAGSFRDFIDSVSYFVAPAFSWQISEKTKLTFNFEYQNYNYTFDDGFLPEPESFRVPISRYLGEPGFSDHTVNSGRASYVLDHQFNENWKLRQGFAAILSSNDGPGVRPDSLAADRRTVNRVGDISELLTQTYTLQNEVLGKFQTGPVAHQVLLGVELYRQQLKVDAFEAPIAPIDLFNPVYGARPGDFAPLFSYDLATNDLGFYVQDQITLLSNLKLLVGGRFDLVRTTFRDSLLSDPVLNDETDFAFSPHAGIVYQPIEPVSLYFSYSTAFNPIFAGVPAPGQTLKPERGDQFEVGIKADLLPERLSATLASYQITKQNVLVTDLANPDFSIQTGEQTSRGMEFNLVGRPLTGWDVTLDYAYTDAFVSEDTTIPIGDRLVGVPRHQAGLWSTYEFQQKPLKGFGVGLGLYYISGDREAALPNTAVELPGYFRMDAAVFYRLDSWKVQLNVNNLTNIDYYNSQGFYVVPQPPLTVLGSVSVEF